MNIINEKWKRLKLIKKFVDVIRSVIKPGLLKK
jgi:hypothetical protein